MNNFGPPVFYDYANAYTTQEMPSTVKVKKHGSCKILLQVFIAKNYVCI